MANGIWELLTRLLGTGKPAQTHTGTKPAGGRISTRTWGGGKAAGPKPSTSADTGYAGDFTGRAKPTYAATDDGNPDPGEVVWAWVPFEEDHSQGKDRPVLVIARDRGNLLGLMLTSKDHDRDAAQEARYGRAWLDVGTGAWDRQNRPSEVRLDRVLQLRPEAVRREGAALPRPVFDQVAEAVTRAKGW